MPTSDRVSIKRHHYDYLLLGDFIEALTKANLGIKRALRSMGRRKDPKPYKPQPTRPVSVRRFSERMNAYLDDTSIVIADIGDSLFGAADLTIHRRTEFISPAYYTSMGFAVPAAIGAQINRRDLRPIVFVGDGHFR